MTDAGVFNVDLGLNNDPSPDAIEKLKQFEQFLVKWNASINMIARSTVRDIWNRHILDSAQLLVCGHAGQRKWVDLGSGAGFPGMVVAILAEDFFPDLRVTLIESDKRKAAFLQEAVRHLNVPVDVIAKRAEEVAFIGADVVSARALAPLSGLCDLAFAHLAPGGTCAFLKGVRADQEVAEARKTWHFELESRASATDNQALVLFMKGLRRV